MTKYTTQRAKSYAYILDNREKIKSKYIRGYVVKNYMTFQDHIYCFFIADAEDKFNSYREMSLLELRDTNDKSQQYQLKFVRLQACNTNHYNKQYVNGHYGIGYKLK